MLQKSASLGLVTHGGSKPVAFSSVLMGNISKVLSYFSRQSIFPEMGILHMFSPFPLLLKKKNNNNKLKSEHINLSNIPKETGNSPHALVRI